jgi:hypothetical protein
MSSHHQTANASSTVEEFGIAGWDAEIDLGILDSTANNEYYVVEDEEGEEYLVGGEQTLAEDAVDNEAADDEETVDDNFDILNRVIIVHPNGQPIGTQRLDISGGVGMEIFDYMEKAGGPNLHELLWNPDTLYQWCVAVCHIGSWIDQKGGLARCWRAAFVFGAARFGQAVMFGGDKSVLRTAWEELETMQFRSTADWYRLINPGNGNQFREQMPGLNLHTNVPVPQDDGCGYVLKDVLDVELLGIACQILEGWYLAVQERQRKHREVVRRQAIVGIVCTKDLEDEDQRCAICLDAFAASTSENAGEEGANSAHIAVKTTCRHLFGLSCFNNWMKDHGNCPLCRQKLIGENRLPHPRDQAVVTEMGEDKKAGSRKVDKRDVQTIREGLLAWDGLKLDAEQHVVCASFIVDGRTQDAYDIMLQQLQTLRAVDNIIGGPSCPILASGPSLKFLVGGSFRDDWGQLLRNTRRLLDLHSRDTGDWSSWSDLQIKELKQMSIECNRRLKL